MTGEYRQAILVLNQSIVFVCGWCYFIESDNASCRLGSYRCELYRKNRMEVARIIGACEH